MFFIGVGLRVLTQEEEEGGGIHRVLTPVQQGPCSLNAQRFYQDSQDGINIYNPSFNPLVMR